MTHSSASWGRTLQNAVRFSLLYFSRGTFKEQRKNTHPCPQAASLGGTQPPAMHSWLSFWPFCFFSAWRTWRRDKTLFYLHVPNNGRNTVSLTVEEKPNYFNSSEEMQRGQEPLPALSGADSPIHQRRRGSSLKILSLIILICVTLTPSQPPLFKAVSDHVQNCQSLQPRPPRSRRRRPRVAPKPAGPTITELVSEAVTASTEPKELPRSKRPRQRWRALTSRQPPAAESPEEAAPKGAAKPREAAPRRPYCKRKGKFCG